MSRLQINEGIRQKADEDLRRLLLEPNPKAADFYYSPYILRIINEIMMERGYSLGIGSKGDKIIVDDYWKDIHLSLETEIEIRIIDCSKTTFNYTLLILLNNHTVKEMIWEELYDIKTLRPRNDRVFTGQLSVHNKLSLEELIKQVTVILENKSIKYKIVNFTVEKEIINVGQNIFEYYIPNNFSFSCMRCNMCELPSNFSINPIPNKNDKPFQGLFTSNRIAFPSNLSCITLSEGNDISSESNKRLEDVCQPIFFQRNKEGMIVDYQLALKQEKGICIFQNLISKKCGIHEIKPLNCYAYPFLTQKLETNHYLIEVDFSCPGINNSSLKSLDSRFTTIQERLAKEEVDEIAFGSIYSLKWDLSNYCKDGERVRQEEVDEACSYLLEKYEQDRNSMVSQ